MRLGSQGAFQPASICSPSKIHPLPEIVETPGGMGSKNGSAKRAITRPKLCSEVSTNSSARVTDWVAERSINGFSSCENLRCIGNKPLFILVYSDRFFVMKVSKLENLNDVSLNDYHRQLL